MQIRGELVEVDMDRGSVEKLMDEFDRPAGISTYIERLNGAPPPPLIYHYCDPDGFAGILNSGELWCGDLFSLNDKSEIRHGVDAACRLLERAAAGAGSTRALEVFASTVIRALCDKLETSGAFFVTCFSSEADDLNQWRAYARDGEGFALGFDTAALEKGFVTDLPQNNGTFPVSYDRDLLDQMQAQLVDDAVRVIRSAGRNVDADLLRRLSVRFSANVIHCASFFKNPSYHSEREYRFLQLFRADIAVPGLRARGLGDASKKYRAYPWRSVTPDALRRVVVGPVAGERGAELARRVLEGNVPSPRDFEVIVSKIPYRGSGAGRR